MSIFIDFTAASNHGPDSRAFASLSDANRFVRRNPTHRFHRAKREAGGRIELAWPQARLMEWCGRPSYRVNNSMGGTMCCTLGPCGLLGHIASPPLSAVEKQNAVAVAVVDASSLALRTALAQLDDLDADRPALVAGCTAEDEDLYAKLGEVTSGTDGVVVFHGEANEVKRSFLVRDLLIGLRISKRDTPVALALPNGDAR